MPDLKRWQSMITVVLAGALASTTPVAAQTAPAASASAKTDTTCAACRDFYDFATSQWRKDHPIPPAYSRWGTFDELQDRNQHVLRGILDAAANTAAASAAPLKASPTGNGWKLGTYYGTCMDSAGIEAAGATPLQPELDRIAALRGGADLQAEVRQLQARGTGALFGFFAMPDPQNSREEIGTLSQGGLGLPDRDYYTKQDSTSARIRAAYVEHIARSFVLLGEDSAAASSEADHVMAIETALANASMTRVAQRDPKATYHKMTEAQVESLAPDFDWGSYFSANHVPAGTPINVRQPDFFKALNSMLGQVPLDQWKSYLRWHLLAGAEPWLSSPFADEAFHFSQVLTGAKQQLPRWKRCLQATDRGLGEALGQAYVKQTFTPQARARALTMVHNLEAALADRIRGLTWMSGATKKQALAKLAAFHEKIGYPDKWRDYSALEVERQPFVLNQERAAAFARAYNLAKIGKPVDPTEWGMTPPTVNAYYNPSMNEIVFPAGILQPPFFDPSADAATNYGGMGAVIGHEMTHGFDDEGRQYDAQGNLHDWWTPADAAKFKASAQKIVDQYSGYEAVPGVKLNGALTQGENIADFGGLTVAYAAFRKAMNGQPETRIDGYTPDQRFFLAWAHIWAQNVRPRMARMLVTVDPHSPGRWRVNGPLSNMPEFARAFHCQAGDPMVRPESERPHIW